MNPTSFTPTSLGAIPQPAQRNNQRIIKTPKFGEPITCCCIAPTLGCILLPLLAFCGSIFGIKKAFSKGGN